ncbi:MAG: hypothetical protein GX600_07665 [Dehalococcoidia bacterium]|nr:hypothetical protein [Dehalococcoidia bacterium]
MTCTLLAVALLASGCAPVAGQMEYERYDDPGGRFSLLIPASWETELVSSEYNPYVGTREDQDSGFYDAWIGVTWGPLPCDRSLVDDAAAWQADILCWGEDLTELSRAEVEVDGRRGLLVECSRRLEDGEAARHLSLVTEAYGILWVVTGAVMDGSRYPDYEEAFRTVLESFVVRGAWAIGG